MKNMNVFTMLDMDNTAISSFQAGYGILAQMDGMKISRAACVSYIQ